MRRAIGFTLAMWASAAVLYLGRDSMAMVALSAVMVFAAFDLLRP
jgi:hypothetical protein